MTSNANKLIAKHTGTLQSRRHFLQTLTAAAGLAAVGHMIPAMASEQRDQIGVQLYTLRGMMEEGVEETLEKVAEVGFKNVEFAGYYDHSAREIAEMLNSTGLRAPACHVMLNDLEDRFETILENAATIGHKDIVIPFLMPDQRSSLADYQRVADKLNMLGETCKQAGLRLGYHNHAFEFETFDGKEGYTVLLEETNPKTVFFEMDLYWLAKADKVPEDYFKAYPGRFPLWHLKDMGNDGQFADLGKGVLDFQSLFGYASLAGYEYGFVEHDDSADPLETIRQGYRTLSQLGQI